MGGESRYAQPLPAPARGGVSEMRGGILMLLKCRKLHHPTPAPPLNGRGVFCATGQCSMVNAQRSMLNGQCSTVNAQWSMVNGQCSTTPFILRRGGGKSRDCGNRHPSLRSRLRCPQRLRHPLSCSPTSFQKAD